MDTSFLKTLVDNGFGLNVTDSGVVVTAANDNVDGNLIHLPATRIKMPITLPIRYFPNQNKHYIAPPPKSLPRVPIVNKQEFDNMEEYRDYLYDRYQEYYDELVDKRKQRLDDRWDKHLELLDAQREVDTRMKEERNEKQS
jgi:hypothetical protein